MVLLGNNYIFTREQGSWTQNPYLIQFCIPAFSTVAGGPEALNEEINYHLADGEANLH